MSKERLGSLLFWGFFIGIFYLCSVSQKNNTSEVRNVKNVKKDTCKVFRAEEILLWTDGTWDSIPYKFESIDSNHNGFPDNEENDTIFNRILETHSDIEDCKNLIERIEEKLDQQNVN